MKYIINGIEFQSKKEIKIKCQQIRDSVSVGDTVNEDDYQYLLDFFSYHHEWERKSASGVTGFVVMMEPTHNTKCFAPVRNDGHHESISFGEALSDIPTGRPKQSKNLRDLKSAGRSSIKPQLREFRHTMSGDTTGMDVDHVFPDTYDSLFSEFCKNEKLDLSKTYTVVGSDYVTQEFIDPELERRWQEYHRKHAKLQMLTKKANSEAERSKINWPKQNGKDIL